MDKRPKQPDIYGLVKDFYDEKAGKVFYVAHAVMRTGGIVQLGKVTETPDEGNTKVPANHPDRAFWSKFNAKAFKELGGAIARIEIDCSLMPCGDRYNGCIYYVPPAIKALGYPDDTDVFMYSHRDQGMAADGESSKRVLTCKVGDNRDALTAAFGGVDDWSWVPWNHRY
jgi:hypothetical protein